MKRKTNDWRKIHYIRHYRNYTSQEIKTSEGAEPSTERLDKGVQRAGRVRSGTVLVVADDGDGGGGVGDFSMTKDYTECKNK